MTTVEMLLLIILCLVVAMIGGAAVVDIKFARTDRRLDEQDRIIAALVDDIDELFDEVFPDGPDDPEDNEEPEYSNVVAFGRKAKP